MGKKLHFDWCPVQSYSLMNLFNFDTENQAVGEITAG